MLSIKKERLNMRLRHKPKAVAQLPQHSFFVEKPFQLKGEWQKAFSKSQPLSLELGCGFGRFSVEFAKRYPNQNLIAVDKSLDVLVGGCRLVSEELPSAENLRTTSFDAYDIGKCIDESDEIESIFIFFCNPWPKRSHNRRRLTFPTLLKQYQKLAVPGAKIYFKTDDKQLYQHSLRYFEQCELEIKFKTENLENDNGFDYLSIQTEYEQKFRALSQNIYAAVVEL